jgi:hypothetical protein
LKEIALPAGARTEEKEKPQEEGQEKRDGWGWVDMEARLALIGYDRNA